jgi:D-threo-aldose 1-dehydrogenase
MSHTQLDRREVGQTGLGVTNLCFGTSALGHMPETYRYGVPEPQALETVRAIFRSPVNFLDTAASYGNGESERRIGMVLRELGGIPAGFVLATKADRDEQTNDFSGDQMRRSVERSLRLLGLEQLQLAYLHDPEHTTFEAATAPGGPVDALVDLKRQGVIGHLGIAGGPIPLMIQFVESGIFEAVISHNRYTLLHRSASRLFDLAAARGMGVLNAAPYGSGILARGPEHYPRYAYQDAPAELVDRARGLAAECERAGVPLAAAALQFSLRDPRIGSTIVGVSRPDRIDQTLELARVTIPDDLWARLDRFADSGEQDPEAHRWD